MREVMEKLDSKQRRRPEQQIYRPGMGLKNKSASNNENKEGLTSPLIANQARNSSDVSSSEDYRNDYRTSSENLSKNVPNSIKQAKNRRPDLKVYVPKAKVIQQLESSFAKAEKSTSMPNFHSDKAANGLQEYKRQPMTHFNREELSAAPEAKGFSSRGNEIGHLKIITSDPTLKSSKDKNISYFKTSSNTSLNKNNKLYIPDKNESSNEHSSNEKTNKKSELKGEKSTKPRKTSRRRQKNRVKIKPQSDDDLTSNAHSNKPALKTQQPESNMCLSNEALPSCDNQDDASDTILDWGEEVERSELLEKKAELEALSLSNKNRKPRNKSKKKDRNFSKNIESNNHHHPCENSNNTSIKSISNASSKSSNKHQNIDSSDIDKISEHLSNTRLIKENSQSSCSISQNIASPQGACKNEVETHHDNEKSSDTKIQSKLTKEQVPSGRSAPRKDRQASSKMPEYSKPPRKADFESELPPHFQKLRQTPQQHSSNPHHGGILKLPPDLPMTSSELSPPRQSHHLTIIPPSPTCVVERKLFNPDNPHKPVIVYESHRTPSTLYHPGMESFPYPSGQPHFSFTLPSSSAHPAAETQFYPYPGGGASPPPSCSSSDLYYQNEIKRIKPIVKKNLNEIVLLENEIKSHINKSFSDIDFTALGRLRWKLQLRYENVILADPRFCAEANVEQGLWKWTFHHPIEMCRRAAEDPSTSPAMLAKAVETLQLLVDEGIVFFENLLEKQQETFGFDLAAFLQDPYNYGKKSTVYRVLAIGIQKIFLYLGDLARYRELAANSCNFGKARNYYLNAQRIAPKNGRPYYQLALLALYTKRKLDAVYYYMRSLAASNPFLSARESMLSIFEETRKKFESMEQHWSEAQWKHLRAKEVEDRVEVWIHPDGRTSARSPHAGGTHTSGTSPMEHGISDLPDAELMKQFVTSFLHVHGKLFTKVGMETFTHTVNHMLKLFRHLLKRNLYHLDSIKLLQLQAINIFTVANTSLKDPNVEPHCRSYLQEQALAVSLDMITLLMERALGLLRDPANVQELGIMLPALKVWTDWMSCQPRLWIPPPGPSPFKSGCQENVWSMFAYLLTALRTAKLADEIELVSEEKEGYELVTLPEEYILAGFVPLLGAPQLSHYAKPPFDQEQARFCVRISRIQFFGDYLCGIENPYLKYDVKNQEFLSAIQEEISSSPKENTPVESEDDGDSTTVSEGSEELSEDSGRPSDEEDPIRRLWSRKEALRRARDRQEKHRARVQAVLRESRRAAVVLEVRPRVLIPDTNCFIDHLDLISRILTASGRHYRLVVPLVVITELDGLARGATSPRPGTPLPSAGRDRQRAVGERAQQAVAFLEARFAARDSCLQAITAKGSVLDTIAFRTEDTARGSNDDIILACCLHYCRDGPTTSHGGEDVPVRVFRDVVLLTEDRNLRVKALVNRVPVRPPLAFVRWANLT